MENLSAIAASDMSVFEQRRRVRRVRMILDLTSSLISSDQSISYREARSLVACAERAISELLPSFHNKFSSFVRPRLERMIQERWPFADEPTVYRAQELVN